MRARFLLGYAVYLTDNVLPRTSLASWQDEFRLAALCLVLPIFLAVIITQVVIHLRLKKRAEATRNADHRLVYRPKKIKLYLHMRG